MRGAIVWVLVGALVAIPQFARAQDREAASRVYEEGARQFEAGNYQLALEAFLRVRELLRGDPRGQALSLYNIARSYDALGRVEDALRTYEQYLADAPSDARNRERTLDRVRELRGRVATRGPAPEASPLVPIGIAVASVGAAALLAAIPTGILALDREQQLGAACDGGRCPQSARPLLDEAHLFADLTDVLWIAGLSVAAVGAALIAIGAVTEGPPAPAAACTEEGCIATITARF